MYIHSGIRRIENAQCTVIIITYTRPPPRPPTMSAGGDGEGGWGVRLKSRRETRDRFCGKNCSAELKRAEILREDINDCKCQLA